MVPKFKRVHGSKLLINRGNVAEMMNLRWISTYIISGCEVDNWLLINKAAVHLHIYDTKKISKMIVKLGNVLPGGHCRILSGALLLAEFGGTDDPSPWVLALKLPLSGCGTKSLPFRMSRRADPWTERSSLLPSLDIGCSITGRFPLLVGPTEELALGTANPLAIVNLLYSSPLRYCSKRKATKL